MTAKQRGLRLLTVNVNGLGRTLKVAALLHVLTTICCSPDVVCLQEIKLPDADALAAALQRGRGAGLPYHAVQYVSAGSGHARGVAVLIKPGCSVSALPDAPAAVDSDGRLVRVDLDFCGHHLSVFSVYAPNTGQASFFDYMAGQLPQDRLCLIGGDFNCICHPMDQTNTGQARFSGAATLTAVMQSGHLIDAFRHLHPAAREFTHIDTHRQSSARLDRWLVSEGCAGWVHSVQHVWQMPGDHAAVLLDLRPPGLPSIGPGVRSFPCHVLYDESLCSVLRARLEAFIASLPEDGAAGAHWRRWCVIKDAVLSTGEAISRSFLKDQASQRLVSAKAVAAAVDALSRAPSSAAAHAQLVAAAHDAQQQVFSQAHRLSQAAEAAWRNMGERCTAWHFMQAGPPHSREPPVALSAAAGAAVDLTSVTASQQLHDLVCEHFSSDRPSGLFRAGAVDADAQRELLAGVECLSPVQAAKADGPSGDGAVTEGCLAAALSTCANGKAPGCDGLPYEVYKVLADLLLPPLVAALNDVFANGVPDHAAWAAGIIILIYKGRDLPKVQLTSYRPITLLNADYKLCQRVISDRMQEPLQALVDPAQTAFIRGRWIGDNVFFFFSRGRLYKARTHARPQGRRATNGPRQTSNS